MNKNQFVSVIDLLQKQRNLDVTNSMFVDKMFSGDSGVYDNISLLKAVLQLLQIHFPKDDEGFCEIEFWLFEQNYGKVGDEIVTVDQLWEKLNKIQS